MIQEAVDRVRSLVGPEGLYISTGDATVANVREQFPDLLEDRLIVEPALRNTGPAVGLECVLLEAHYPNCTVASLGSDHHIGKPEEFCRLLRVAEAALEDLPDTLFTVGVKPTRAETGYGYIQKGGLLCSVDDEPIYTVKKFIEKPDEERARAYTQSGNYLWNSNMFIWKARTVLGLFAQFEPEIYEILMEIQDAVGTEDEAAVIEREYPRMKDISVDHAVIERAGRVAALEADIDWSDIGSWGALTDVLPTDAEGNLFSGEIVAMDARNVTAYGPEGKLIALVGVEGLVVVDTSDALLICRRDKAQRVKDLVTRLNREEGKERYT